jgi:hypothetical protein
LEEAGSNAVYKYAMVRMESGAALRRLLICELEKIFSSLKGAELYHSYLVRKGSWLSHLFLLTTYFHDLKVKV